MAPILAVSLLALPLNGLAQRVPDTPALTAGNPAQDPSAGSAQSSSAPGNPGLPVTAAAPAASAQTPSAVAPPAATATPVAAVPGASAPSAPIPEAAAGAHRTFKALPQPGAIGVGDIVAIFTDKSAPSQWTLESCDKEFLTHSASFTSVQESRALAQRLVLSDPARYHWCFYSKILETVMPAPDANAATGNPGPAAKKQPSAIFLNSIAQAMDEEFQEKRYLSALQSLEKLAAETIPPTDFKDFPHAEGLGVADIMRVFTDKRAPSLESLSTCDSKFTTLSRTHLQPEALAAAMEPEVKSDPAAYHWCFYSKLLEMRMPQDWRSRSGQGPAEKPAVPARENFQFLSSVGRAFHTGFKIERYLETARTHFAKSTTPVDPTLLPHPTGTDMGDVMAIFTEKYAPSPEEFADCDRDFLKLQEELREPTTLRKALGRAIRSDPAKYHWCVYAKIIEAADPVGDPDQRAGQGRDDRILGAFLFISKVANAFAEEYGDPRYKIAAITHYRELSRKSFFRSVETRPETTLGLVRAYTLPDPGTPGPAAGNRQPAESGSGAQTREMR